MLDKHLGIAVSQQYFFQLIPTHINVLNRSLAKSLKSDTNFRLNLFKGIQKSFGSNPIPGQVINKQIELQKMQIGFSLPNYSPNRSMKFTLKLMQEEEQCGNYDLDVNLYVKSFKDGKGYFSEQFPISNSFSISLELFVDKSRFNLEKAIREVRSQNAHETRESARSGAKEKEGPGTPRNGRKTFQQSRSEVSHKSGDQEQQQKFMSPKKYSRKHDGPERKLLMRSNRSNSDLDDVSSNQGSSHAITRKRTPLRIDHRVAGSAKIEARQYTPQRQRNPHMRRSVEFGNQLKSSQDKVQESSKFIIQNVSQKSQSKNNVAVNPHYQSLKPTHTRTSPSARFLVQRADSIMINSEQEMIQQKIMLAESTSAVYLKKQVKHSTIHTLKQSRNSKLEKVDIQAEQREKQKEKSQTPMEQAKKKAGIFLFILISIFLIYNAMTPAKKFNSRKRKVRRD